MYCTFCFCLMHILLQTMLMISFPTLSLSGFLNQLSKFQCSDSMSDAVKRSLLMIGARNGHREETVFY